MTGNQHYEVVVIGGSYAGLSAGLALGRSARRVLIVDSGKPCNRQTPHSHNFLTRDGIAPAELAAIAKDQVLKYPTVQFLEDHVSAAEGTDGNFRIELSSGNTVTSVKIIFAAGIVDEMPKIKGFEACWGISAIHCPYCHGYEYKGQITGLLANGDIAADFAKLVNHWAYGLILFTNGPSVIADEKAKELAELHIPVIETPVKEIIHENGYLSSLLLEDDQNIVLQALYAKLPFKQHCSIPQQLGCAMTEQGFIQVDDFQKTNVPGVFAAGDCTTMMRSVAAAVSGGGKAGAFVNHELIFNR
ncbi:NAD(P)/FAD-dependent oxidoreductase [Pedobacter sp. JY14-1]|uniref:NAD(P)/FAD-dependent oxidoreductase n=1 Tax=Pedobacter sp. JY14-1 TaxID=3034151 RepID=UPI0023E11C93|nr:NAD(P)/FAD-dependent oxidoreductase [Pedobacter sp. JY14-1]